MNTDIPVVYTAVSDPVSAGLANEDGSSIGNITGSSDILPVEEQLKMIRAMLPDAKKIGILYTTSEANSCSTIEEYKSWQAIITLRLLTRVSIPPQILRLQQRIWLAR